MAILQDDTPVYRETLIALGPNGIYRLNRTFDTFVIIDLVGNIEISINDAEFTVCRAGVGYTMPGGKKITSLVVRETAGSTANVNIATADGAIQDNRASFAGNLAVVNAAAPNQILHVDLAATDPGLLALAAAIIANQNNDADKRAHLTTLAGATFATAAVNAAEQTIVASGTNVNGIIVRRAWTVRGASDKPAYFGAGAGQPFVGWATTNNVNQSVDSCENIFIPPGVALVSHTGNDARSICHIWYEVL